jgi:hypothetical protein
MIYFVVRDYCVPEFPKHWGGIPLEAIRLPDIIARQGEGFDYDGRRTNDQEPD